MCGIHESQSDGASAEERRHREGLPCCGCDHARMVVHSGLKTLPLCGRRLDQFPTVDAPRPPPKEFAAFIAASSRISSRLPRFAEAETFTNTLGKFCRPSQGVREGLRSLWHKERRPSRLSPPFLFLHRIRLMRWRKRNGGDSRGKDRLIGVERQWVVDVVDVVGIEADSVERQWVVDVVGRKRTADRVERQWVVDVVLPLATVGRGRGVGVRESWSFVRNGHTVPG